MKRILVDMQVCQNESRYRGVGRYTVSLVKSLLKLGADCEFHFLFNGYYAHLVPSICSELDHDIPHAQIHVIDFVNPNGISDINNAWRYETSKLLLETYLNYLKPDIFFCPNYFEGFADEVITSIGTKSDVPTIVTMHDLIPLIYEDRYLTPDYGFSRFYRAKLEEVKRATAMIAISQSAKGEAVEYLRYPADRIVNASESAEEKFRVLEISTQDKTEILGRLGITKPFILYTGAADHRKNLAKMVEAFAALPEETKRGHDIIFAGKMPAFEVQTLKDIARQHKIDQALKFLGYVSDDDLIALYNFAELFVFPSYHEGFGLPPLEAMKCGTAVIASNRSSIPEVVAYEEALFDPDSRDDIRNKMQKALTDKNFKEKLITLGHAQAKKFSWEETARKTLDCLLKFAENQDQDALNWSDHHKRLSAIDEDLLAQIGLLTTPAKHVTQNDMCILSQAMANNRVRAEQHIRAGLFSQPPAQLAWRIEGPFDSSYSLALVNREFATSLNHQGIDVSLLSSEGPGDFEPSAQFLKDHDDLNRLYQKALSQSQSDAHIVSRNMYPPRVGDMYGAFNALHNYAWEETAFPQAYVCGINENLQFMTVVSEHVKKILIDNGVRVPIAVVGNGVDHWEAIEPTFNVKLSEAAYKFLHVSSCFPRKGVDVLLDAYGKAFTLKDDVILIIKTFPNPHNEVETLLNEMREKYPDYPNVQLIMDDLNESDLKGLFERIDCFVAPSRAEGFGLPIAEAILAGKHVITTHWSGALDFLTPDNAALLDFNYEKASTHEGEINSVWAEPDCDHLAELLKQKVLGKDLPQTTKSKNKKHLLSHLSWEKVAQKSVAAGAQALIAETKRKPKVGWVSTFDKKCGIATYSAHLIEYMSLYDLVILGEGTIEDYPNDPPHVLRCWREGHTDNLEQLYNTIKKQGFDIIVIQFNYGFFNFEYFDLFLKKLHKLGCSVVLTMHSTTDPAHDRSKRLSALKQVLSNCERLLVHTIEDLNRLKACGMDQNATLFPHGIKLPPNQSLASKAGNEHITIASYGFALPNKGLVELLEALSLMNRQDDKYRLKLINAEFPVIDSKQYIAEINAMIDKLSLHEKVATFHDFLPDEKSHELISSADILAYPYQKTSESVSGAVRYGLASGKPVAVTPLSIFDDVREMCYLLPGISPHDIANGLFELSDQITSKDQNILDREARAQDWRELHDYANLSKRLSNILVGIFNNR